MQPFSYLVDLGWYFDEMLISHYRIPGQPATRSKLLSITGSILPPSARHADWTAEVAKVQRCSSSEYNGGEGMCLSKVPDSQVRG